MNSYRTSPPRPAPTVIRVKRSPLMAVVLLACLTPLIAMSMQVFSRSEVACSRSANQCEIVVIRGPEVLRDVQTIPLSTIKRAFLESTWDRKHRTQLHGLALEVSGGPLVIDGYSNANNDLKQAWVDEFNRFLHDSSKQRLEIGYGTTWPSFVGLGIALVAILAYARARLRFIVDGAERVFRVENRIFRTTVKVIPFERIVEAFLHETANGQKPGTVHFVALRLVDGTHLELDSQSAIDRKMKVDLVEKINEALKAARS